MKNLALSNIDEEIRRLAEGIEEIGPSIHGVTGVALLDALKRQKVGVGPYPGVSLFEAANRIMSDLVILHGVKWLLETESFPFSEYRVELGHGNVQPFDIQAVRGAQSLAGEAFNVAPSFFQGKKSAMLGKLRKDATEKTYRLILVNHDAVAPGYSPKLRPGESFLLVNVGSAACEIFNSPQK